ncbi:hypothetical protein HK105_203537 [Polyrhizophydium stewartii]|uniref:DUF885 domain-containing protein n=1 Tax=Polyrhizophydium stewartii TaxID=2732419 RepID=A0ABR4NB69_9FUNG|nr:hypothetical protein HK105_007508 [Polyrhizophydium stewartii]
MNPPQQTDAPAHVGKPPAVTHEAPPASDATTELRTQAETALAGRFDAAAFAACVAGHASEPAEAVEAAVRAWIDSVKAASPGYFGMRAVMDDLADALLQRSPFSASLHRLPVYQDELFNVSKAAETKLVDRLTGLRARVASIDPAALTPAERDDLDQVARIIDDTLLHYCGYGPVIPTTHMFGVIVFFFEMLRAYQPLKTADDARNFRKRLELAPERFGFVVERFREGVERGVTLPGDSVAALIDRVGKMIVEDPRESVFFKTFKDKIVAVGLSEEFLLEPIGGSVMPAYKAVKDFLETEYKPHARANAGIFGLHDYERVYNDTIYANTTTRMTADELHQKGLDEVARIRKRIEAIKDKVFDGTLKEFLEALKDKERFPQLFFEKQEDVIPHYKALIERIDAKMPQYFNKFPKFKCAVEPATKESEASAPIALYRPGTADKPGEFVVNLRTSMTSPNHSAMALALHEAIPGHHHERSLALERPKTHILFKLSAKIAYAEGWGLYAEYLGEEMGMYDTDFDLLGRLDMEMFRALRLVVDTGLHAKNWTVEQCVAYMKEHVAKSDVELLNEVKRYAIMPGQALAYKVGELKIIELRKRAEKALSSKFDIRAFHDVVLDHGAVHLETLEKNVDEWIESVKAQFPEYFEMRAIMDEFVLIDHKLNPMLGTVYGIASGADDIFDQSPEAFATRRAQLAALLARAKAIDASKLPVTEHDNLEVVRRQLQSSVVWNNGYTSLIPTTHMFGLFAGFHDLLTSYQSLDTVEDAHNLRKRLELTTTRFAGMVESFRVGLERGVTLPEESIVLLIGSIGKILTEDARENPFFASFKDKIVKLGLPEEFLLEPIREHLVPAYKAVKDFLETEYKPHARANPGIFGLPDYERVYNDMIYYYTTTRMTADELHQKGLDEVARIRKRIEAIKDKVFDGTLREFLEALKDKERFPQLFFEKQEDVIPHYKALIERIDAKMPQYFNKFPKFKCAVDRVSKESEASAPTAFYMGGTPTRAGKFFVNLHMSMMSPNHSAMALALHEAIPGHHHQVSLARERPTPHLFFKLVRTVAYSEGWGLYAEYLGEEMGMYDTDFDLLGRLDMEMFRALRLVVDTGLHAKGWTIEQCVAYMKEHVSVPDEEVVGEVKRYSIAPGQALAYKVGELKIIELRKRAEEALGDQFDIRAFHDVVLDHGAVHLETLEKNVGEWIASVLAPAASA